ncbi:hypothetical protein CHUAL_006408 [Chamberlinius hualienensis]
MSKLSAIVLALSALLGAALGQDPVKVEVYYESKCPDSRAFISAQLWPTYQIIPELFTVTWVPFGKANFTSNSTSSSYDFVCQHGPEECYGNEIHSCAVTYYPDNAINVNFIGCSMSAQNPVTACQGCAMQYGLEWDLLYDCANAAQGSDLLHDNGLLTQSLQPPLTYVPWIVINDVYSDANEQQAQTDFKSLICQTYTGPLPPACTA